MADLTQPLAATPRSRGRLSTHRGALIGLTVLVTLVAVSLAAPLIAPFDPTEQSLRLRFTGPSTTHLLGTDALGRDIFSRLLHAGSITIGAAFGAVALSVLLGVPSGLVAGYFGGAVDWGLAVLNDTFMAVPPIVFALAVIGVRGPGLVNAMLAIGVLLSPRLLRVSRAVASSARDDGSVVAARAIGCSHLRIMFRHILPNSLTPVLVQLSFMVALAVIAESSLSFLGLGAQPPTATWGAMLKDGFDHAHTSAFPLLPPAVMTSVTILCLSTLGDELRDMLSTTGGGRR